MRDVPTEAHRHARGSPAGRASTDHRTPRRAQSRRLGAGSHQRRVDVRTGAQRRAQGAPGPRPVRAARGVREAVRPSHRGARVACHARPGLEDRASAGGSREPGPGPGSDRAGGDRRPAEGPGRSAHPLGGKRERRGACESGVLPGRRPGGPEVRRAAACARRADKGPRTLEGRRAPATARCPRAGAQPRHAARHSDPSGARPRRSSGRGNPGHPRRATEGARRVLDRRGGSGRRSPRRGALLPERLRPGARGEPRRRRILQRDQRRHAGDAARRSGGRKGDRRPRTPALHARGGVDRR